MVRARSCLLLSAVLLSACESALPNLPQGKAAYAAFPAPQGDLAIRNYAIGPLDTIAITVFQEPDLTLKDVQVDAAGNVLLPLIGDVRAAGLTSTQLAQEIGLRLRRGYLSSPQVSVIIQESVSQKVTVEGSVTDPGVYEIKGRTTLLDALAMAKGPSRVARLREVIVFREIAGKQSGAMFDVSAIRRGDMENPEILGNDTVVVGLSHIKAAWRDILTASPLVAAFRPFG